MFIMTYASRSRIRDLNVPTSLPRDDVSVLQIYAGNAFNAVVMPVWDSIKPDEIPTYPGWGESLYNIFIRSCEYFMSFPHACTESCMIFLVYASRLGYNIFCILVPLVLSWVAKFKVFNWDERVNFVRKSLRAYQSIYVVPYCDFQLVYFIAMIPLQKTLDWGAGQMGLFLGQELSDLLVITLSK